MSLMFLLGTCSLTFLTVPYRLSGVITSSLKAASLRWRTGCLEISTPWPSSSSSSLCCRYKYCNSTACVYCRCNGTWSTCVSTRCLCWVLLSQSCVYLWSDGGDLPGQDSDLRHREGQIQLLMQEAESSLRGRSLPFVGGVLPAGVEPPSGVGGPSFFSQTCLLLLLLW